MSRYNHHNHTHKITNNNNDDDDDIEILEDYCKVRNIIPFSFI